MNTAERTKQLASYMLSYPETDIIELIRYIVHFENGYISEKFYTISMIFDALDSIEGKDLFHRGRVRQLPVYYCKLD